MKKDRYKKVLHILLVLACICLPLLVFASNSTEPKHIKERIATLGKAYMEIDMPEPALPPATLPQMKMERIHFDKDLVKDLFAKYCIQASRGDSWRIEINEPLNPELEIVFSEENGRYGATYYSDDSPKTPLDENNVSLVKANNTVKNFLDELGLVYEYPFSVVAYDRFIASAQEPPFIVVVARLMIEGIPCHTSIGWTKNSIVGPEAIGDPTPLSIFSLNEEGKIVSIVVQNPVRVLKIKEDTRPIKAWREILEKDKDFIMQHRCTGESPSTVLILKQAELLMMVDANQIAYPAWIFSFDEEGPYCDPEYPFYIQLSYDARTGERVWMQ